MLDLYDHAERWDELIELTRQTRQKGWWRAYGLNDQGYIPLETEASSVREVAIGHVPGLLQTEHYARAVFHAAAHRRSPDSIDRDVGARMHRQRRLTSVDDPLDVVAILDEAVLHRRLGGPVVTSAQLAHLVAAARLPSVTLQVLPFSGSHPAVSAGFSLLGFADLGMPDVVYVEHPAGSVHIDKAADVARATLTFDRLRSLALDPESSVALIERMAAQTQ